MKINHKIIFLLLMQHLILNIQSFSQIAPAIQWAKCFGGSESDDGRSIQQTNDGGYIIAGLAASTDGDITGNIGGLDYWIVKTDSGGNIEWQNNLGGTSTDDALSVQQTFDSGYILGGLSYSNDGNVSGNHSSFGSADYWVVKLDSGGVLQWQKCFGGSSQDQESYIMQTSDSGYLAIGFSGSNDSNVTGNHGSSDIWAVKLDTAGNLQWQKCYGGTSSEYGFSACESNDGGFIIAGSTDSNDGDVTGNHGFEDFWIVKTDALGNLQWQKSLGGTLQERAYCIKKTFDNGFIVTGKSKSNNGDVSGNHGNDDIWTIKIDSVGNIQWQKCYGGTNRDEGKYVEQTFDGGFIVGGFTQSNDSNVTGNHGQQDYWILKLDSIGNMIWQKCYGGTLSDIAYCIRQTSDSGYVIAGASLSHDGDVTGNHDTTGLGLRYDYWVIKLGPDNITGIPDYQLSIINYQFFPNPLTNQSKLTFKNLNKETFLFTLYDITGRITERVSTTDSEIVLTKGSKQPGIYLFNLVNEKSRERWNGKTLITN